MNRTWGLLGVLASLGGPLACDPPECVYYNDCPSGSYCGADGLCVPHEDLQYADPVFPASTAGRGAGFPLESRLLVTEQGQELLVLLTEERLAVRVASGTGDLLGTMTLDAQPEKGRVLDDGAVLVLFRDVPRAVVIDPLADGEVVDEFVLEAPASASAVQGNDIFFAFGPSERVVRVDRPTHEVRATSGAFFEGVVTSMELVDGMLAVVKQGSATVTGLRPSTLAVDFVQSLLAQGAPVRRLGPITMSGEDHDDINVPFEEFSPEILQVLGGTAYYGPVTVEGDPILKTSVGRLSFDPEKAYAADAPTTRLPLSKNNTPLIVSATAVAYDGAIHLSVDRSTGDVLVFPRLADGTLAATAHGRLDGTVGSRDIALSPGGGRIYLYNPVDNTLTAFGTPSPGAVASAPEGETPTVGGIRYRTTLAANVLPADVVRGERLFFETSSRVSATETFACASCHVDGGDDGMQWGGKATMPLYGRADTMPFHWNNEIQTPQDLNTITIQQRMGGTGLSGAEMDDLFAYLETIDAPAGLDPDNEDVLRGRALFFSESLGCAHCHYGASFTDGQLHSFGDRPPVATPVLRGLAYTAPYLSDRSVDSLEDLVELWVRTDLMGHGADMNDDQAAALVAYLKSL